MEMRLPVVESESASPTIWISDESGSRRSVHIPATQVKVYRRAEAYVILRRLLDCSSFCPQFLVSLVMSQHQEDAGIERECRSHSGESFSI